MDGLDNTPIKIERENTFLLMNCSVSTTQQNIYFFHFVVVDTLHLSGASAADSTYGWILL